MRKRTDKLRITRLISRMRGKALLIFAFALLLTATGSVAAQNTNPTQPSSPQPTSPPVPAPVQPPPSSTQQPTNNPNPPGQPNQPSPNSPNNVSPATGQPNPQPPQPGSPQDEQRTNPGVPQSPQPSQVAPTGQSPATGLPNPNAPAGTNPNAPNVTNPNAANPNPAGVNAANGTNVGAASGVAPAELPTEPPPVAPNFEASSRPLPSAERIGVDIMQQTPLTLNDAIALALQDNNDIDTARIDVRIAEFNLLGVQGVYDPIFVSENYYERRVTPTASTIGGARNGSVIQTTAAGTASLGGFVPYAGGAYQFDFNSSRVLTNNQNATLNPQFPSALTLSYTQPLWRGLRFDLNRRNIEIAKKNLSLSDAQFRQRAIEIIAQVEQAYWDLVFALRNLQVQIDAVKQARVQVESNQRLVAQGVLAPIDIIAAGTQVTTFEQSVYTAQEAVTRAENTLKTLILRDRTAPMWTLPLTPVTPVSLEAPRVPLEQAVSLALANRPEIAQLQTNAEINQLDTRYYSDQTKPQIDLIGTYTSTGLSGITTQTTGNNNTSTTALLVARVNQLSGIEGLPVLPVTVNTAANTPPENLIGGYPQSLANLLQQDYPTYRVGVRITLPLRNRTAEANLGRSLVTGTRIERQRAQTEQIIEADVRNALQALRSSEARLQSAAASRSSAELQYESEQRQFRAGTSTVFLVLQRQTELLVARSNELLAQTALNKSITEFQRATGNTLQANNVAIRTTGEPRANNAKTAH